MDDATPIRPKKPRTRREPAPTTPDPIEIAMEAEASGKAPTGEASALLAEQRRLVRWQVASERAGFALKVLTGMAGVAAAAVLGWMAWSASQANGLVIEAFSTPPALAQRGVTGEAAARRLMDDFSLVANEALSSEAPKGVAASWENNISIDIAGTGISFDQIDQWLRRKLGHETRVSGEIRQEADGALTLVARFGGTALAPISGQAGDIEAMLLKAAETIYAREQPRTFGLYIFRHRAERYDEAMAHYVGLVNGTDPEMRAYGYNMIGSLVGPTEGPTAQARYLRMAISIFPDRAALGNLYGIENALGRLETARTLNRQSIEAARRQHNTRPEALEQYELNFRARDASALGDYAAMEAIYRKLSQRTLLSANAGLNGSLLSVAVAQAGAHDIAAAEATLAAFRPFDPPSPNKQGSAISVRASAEDWETVRRAAEARLAETVADPGPAADLQARNFRTRLATALARLGQAEAAQAAIAPTPLDCQPCVVARGVAAEAARDYSAADHWFGEAVRMAPSLPMANLAWGRALLERGKPDAAIEKLRAANKQSPKFADPIAFWGEALLAKGDVKGAAVRFQAAARITPKWGRLHLKWGEALAKLGKGPDAKAEFGKAAGLFLTAAERAELGRVQGAR